MKEGFGGLEFGEGEFSFGEMEFVVMERGAAGGGDGEVRVLEEVRCGTGDGLCGRGEERSERRHVWIEKGLDFEKKLGGIFRHGMWILGRISRSSSSWRVWGEDMLEKGKGRWIW